MATPHPRAPVLQARNGRGWAVAGSRGVDPAYAGGMESGSQELQGWRPDRAWADPLIVFLAVLALFLSGYVLQRRAAPAPLLRAGLQGRMAELPLAAEQLLGPGAAGLFRNSDLERLARPLGEPWDRALVGVAAAERGDLALGRRLAPGGDLQGPAAPAFRRCWARAYEGGAAVTPAERALVRRALGDGWAAGLLEARLDGGAAPPSSPTRATVLRRLGMAGLLGLAVAFACLASLGVALALLLNRTSPPPPPAPELSGRALLLVLLGWYLGLLVSGTLTAPLVQVLPALRPYTLTLNVGLHAGWGCLLLRRALGPGWPRFWKGLWSGGSLRSLGWGLAHLALAVPLVLAASWAAGPLTRRFPAPQREMVEFLAGLEGVGPLLAAALTVALVAPLFEELLFRGTLLPFLARRWGWGAAILGSGLLFGAIHLQPAGLPTLGVLGMVLGAAFRRGGSLVSAVLLHALWNGAIFLFLRTMVA